MNAHWLRRYWLRGLLLLLLAVVFGLFLGFRYIGYDLHRAMVRPQTRLSPLGERRIVRSPPPAQFQRGKLAALPRYDPRSAKNWQVDLRGYDLRSLDLRDRLDDLRHADFDHRTRWPEKLPAGFDPAAILEHCRNPGLGVRRLHARGITGEGIGLGIIDQALLVGHAEYREQLRCYEEIHLFDHAAQMHGPAVASIAVGKSVGVAPGADLYYIANGHGTYDTGKYVADFTYLAEAIDRMLAINAGLPADRKLRVISLSVGWNPTQKGFVEVMAAVKRATAANVFVVSSSLEDTHDLWFHGLGREQMADPDSFEAHGPGSWWAARFWRNDPWLRLRPRLLVPMDARATASPTGANDYVYYNQGGWSWSIPWIAGLYALACQVQPSITPEVFWREALASGKTIRVTRGSQERELGVIADPVALIERLTARPRLAAASVADR